MELGKKKYVLLLSIAFFVVYFFVASQPIPLETILIPRWLSSLETNYPVSLKEPENSAESPAEDAFIPFELGNRFGYVDDGGRFIINRLKQGLVSVSDEYWAEYKAVPEGLEIRDPQEERLIKIEEGNGYPFFMDGRIFLINEERNSLRAVNTDGSISWAYDFAAPLTDMDAAAGLILAGSLDGTVELLDGEGKRIFFFEPGGSRLSAIYGCRISGDGSKLAIVSGYDDQRFLFLERSGDSYKVAFHEFIADGFRRQMYLAFIDNDNRVIFERQGGVGIYDIAGRSSLDLDLPGTMNALDSYGGDNLVFVVNSPQGRMKELVAIRLPGRIILKAPFRSQNTFLARVNNYLYVGGGGTIASFELDKR